MADHPKDILRELSLRHIRLTQGPALATIDPLAKVMYVVSGIAPVRISCVSLTARFEPTDLVSNTVYSFVPKKLYLAVRGDYLVLVGNTYIVAFYVREFLRNSTQRALKSRLLMAGITVRDCCPHGNKLLILTDEALLRIDPSDPEQRTPEELVYFGADFKQKPLRLCVRESPLTYWVLFDNNSIGILSQEEKCVARWIELREHADDFTVVSGAHEVPDVLVTCSRREKTINCHYMLSEDPRSVSEGDLKLFAQVNTGFSDMSLSPIPNGVTAQGSLCLGALTLTTGASGITPVYTPLVSARSVRITSVEAYFDPMGRRFVLGLDDGTIHSVEVGAGLSPLEVRVADDAPNTLGSPLVPPQKVVFDPRKESAAVIMGDTLDELVVYADAVLRDSNTRMERIAGVYVECMEIIKAIGKNLEKIKAAVDRNEKRVLDVAKRRGKIDARYDSVFSREEYEALNAKFVRIKEDFARRQEEFEAMKTN